MKKYNILIISLLLMVGCSSLEGYSQKNKSRESKVATMYPVDGSTLPFTTDDFFTFVWDKSFLKSGSLYFLLVPLYEGQNPEEAIVKNPPIYKQDKIEDYYINYPWNAPYLKHGSYVWQVQAKNGKPLLTSSFDVGDEAISPDVLMRYVNRHVYLQEKLDGSYHRAYDKFLLIHYNEPYYVSDAQGLRYRVLDERRNVIVSTTEMGESSDSNCPLVPINIGENWLAINLAACTNYDIFYTLEVWNTKGETYYLRFICSSSEPLIVPIQPN